MNNVVFVLMFCEYYERQDNFQRSIKEHLFITLRTFVKVLRTFPVDNLVLRILSIPEYNIKIL